MVIGAIKKKEEYLKHCGKKKIYQKEFRNVTTYSGYWILVFHTCGFYNLYYVEFFQMNKEIKEGLAFLFVLGLGWSAIILLNWLIN